MNPAEPKRLPPLTKLALEIGPLVLFFLGNAYAERFGVAHDRRIFAATGVFLVATVVSLALHYGLVRKLPIMPLVSGVVVLVFGGLTLALNDKTFIKLKPTVVNLLFAGVLLGGLWARKPFLAMLLDSVLDLTPEGWRKLTLRWALFFLFLAGLNEIVWRTQSDDVWINFKLIGLTGLTLAFALAQTRLIMRHEAGRAERDKAG